MLIITVLILDGNYPTGFVIKLYLKFCSKGQILGSNHLIIYYKRDRLFKIDIDPFNTQFISGCIYTDEKRKLDLIKIQVKSGKQCGNDGIYQSHQLLKRLLMAYFLLLLT